MPPKMIVHGVPRGIAQDGWWLDANTSHADEKTAPLQNLRTMMVTDPTKRRLTLLLLVLAGADVLFFQHTPGISIAVFAIILFAASILAAERPRLKTGPVLVLLLSILPVIEYAQFTAILFVVLGLVVSVAWNRIGTEPSLTAVLQSSRRFMILFPITSIRSDIHWVKVPPTKTDFGGVLRGFVQNWAFPVGGGLLISALLISANPVLERWINAILDVEFDVSTLIARACFWGGAALVVWPFLALTSDQLTVQYSTKQRGAWRYGLNAQSVSNALIVFNILLAVQLVLDGQFFWAGGDLPSGISYAKYAHRGAYPLLLTALLAGAFALAARPFLEQGRWLKPLMVVWLGLNVLLTLSSMYRLGIYVDAYGLTYLRIRAGIWMVLVAIWLGMIGWQIWCEKANGWLLLRSFGLGISVLYIGCFVNFAHIIAAHNLDHPRETNVYYLCQLDDTASGALWGELNHRANCAEKPEFDNWRDWGFREWRVARYIETIKTQEARDENPRR